MVSFCVITVLIFAFLTFTQQVDFFYFDLGVKPYNKIVFYYFYHRINVCLKPITYFVKIGFSKVLRAQFVIYFFSYMFLVYFNP